jgi:CheY-like chemotaxis protein
MLEPVGYQIVEAADGLEALQQIHMARPDLILLDVVMPNLDGWGVLEQIRSTPALQAIPVVLVSGHVVADYSQVQAWGAVGLLPKPFQVSALRTLVAEVLNQRGSDT